RLSRWRDRRRAGFYRVPRRGERCQRVAGSLRARRSGLGLSYGALHQPPARVVWVSLRRGRRLVRYVSSSRALCCRRVWLDRTETLGMVCLICISTLHPTIRVDLYVFV